MEPLLFHPIHKKMVWGYESWDISCRPGEMGIVENGANAGMRFDEVIRMNPDGVLGTKVKEFPLLVKIIGTHDDLSIQVHPDDDYAKKHGFESGKNEMWYMLKTPGKLIIGLKDGTTPEMLKNDTIASVGELAVKPGDMVDIRAGLVHSIVKDTVLVEIQQNSDVTFRIYDYGRMGLDGKPRELHMEHALAVVDFYGKIPVKVCEYVSSPFFTVVKEVVNGQKSDSTNPESFTILTCVGGSCFVQDVPLANSRSVFLPAGLGEYSLRGNAVLLKTTLPGTYNSSG